MAWGDVGDRYGAGGDLEVTAHEEGRCGWLARHPQRVTPSVQEGGWSETSGGVTRVEFLQVFYRQEDADRKNAVVCLNECHTSYYFYLHLSICHTRVT